ncbi:MAG: hypothetical protein KGS73_12845 [Chloroflexi bacterium]|nr:hypothetical protein [Chloroflexota bacterium]
MSDLVLLWMLACVLLIGFALWGLSRVRTVRDNHVAVVEHKIDASLRFVTSRTYWLSLFEQEIGQLDTSSKEGELRLTEFTYSGINVTLPVKYRYQLDPKQMDRKDLIAILQKYKESAISSADQRQFSRILEAVLQEVVSELKPAHPNFPPETTDIQELLSPFKGASEAKFRRRFAQLAQSALQKEGVLIKNAITLDEPILPEEITAAHQDRISAHFASESQKNSIERLRQAVPDLPTEHFVQLVQDVHNPPQKVVYRAAPPQRANPHLAQTDPPAPDLPTEAPYTFDLPLTDAIMVTLK